MLIEGVILGVILILGVLDIEILMVGVTLGVILILGVLEILMVGVTLGVILGEGVGEGVGEMLIEGVILGVALGLLVGVSVGVGDGVKLGVGVGDGAMLAFFLVITTIPCSYIILPTYSFTLYKFGENILPSPSSYKVPLTGLSNLKEFGFI